MKSKLSVKFKEKKPTDQNDRIENGISNSKSALKRYVLQKEQLSFLHNLQKSQAKSKFRDKIETGGKDAGEQTISSDHSSNSEIDNTQKLSVEKDLATLSRNTKLDC